MIEPLTLHVKCWHFINRLIWLLNLHRWFQWMTWKEQYRELNVFPLCNGWWSTLTEKRLIFCVFLTITVYSIPWSYMKKVVETSLTQTIGWRWLVFLDYVVFVMVGNQHWRLFLISQFTGTNCSGTVQGEQTAIILLGHFFYSEVDGEKQNNDYYMKLRSCLCWHWNDRKSYSFKSNFISVFLNYEGWGIWFSPHPTLFTCDLQRHYLK